jgi:hypothetical protein
LNAVWSAIDSGTTVGSTFVWILIAVAVGMVALAWIRFRRRVGD